MNMVEIKSLFDAFLFSIIVLCLYAFFVNMFLFFFSSVHKELRIYLKEKRPNTILFVFSPSYSASTNRKKNLIHIGLKWFLLTLKDKKYIEYIKTSICHELAHKDVKSLKYSYYTNPEDGTNLTKQDVKRICSWVDEFNADRIGCKKYWAGTEDTFLKKMIFINNGYSDTFHDDKEQNKKRKKKTHPTWSMRMYYMDKDIKPTFDNIKELYVDFYSGKDREEFNYVYTPIKTEDSN